MKDQKLTTREYLIPFILMGWLADTTSTSIGFLAPIPCFAFILYYALKEYKVKSVTF